MQGWVDLVGLLHTEIVYPPEYGHQSKYWPGPTCVNFVHATNSANHYATPYIYAVNANTKMSVSDEYLNTSCERVKRLKKFWTRKLQLTLYVLQKHVPSPLIVQFSRLKVFQSKVVH